ncbi:MAG TPA: BrnT family toxin [Candidimonas sp.]|nr:BrnT family toxin [Candidimonas sp.]
MILEWDPAKDVINIAKHGLSLIDAKLVYDAPYKITVSSPQQGEDRQMDIALVETVGIVLVLVYVARGPTLRAISLRRASKAERRFYVETRNKAQ